MKIGTVNMQTIDEYIAHYPEAVQDILQKVRGIIQVEAPLASEALKYGIPTFVLQKKNLVHFGAFAHHLGFYPTPSAIAHFAKALKGYKTAKGSVQFPFNEPIPYDLISEMVKFRVKESRG